MNMGEVQYCIEWQDKKGFLSAIIEKNTKTKQIIKCNYSRINLIITVNITKPQYYDIKHQLSSQVIF